MTTPTSPGPGSAGRLGDEDPTGAPGGDRDVAGPWWRSGVIYEVYLRSFADGSGDGIGDIRGLHDRLLYLRDLGVDAIWITPWYPSPMHDGGYDVADYRDIDPLFGSLAEAETVIQDAHSDGMRVIVDMVANHTSIAHPWFQAALAAGPGSPERDRYHFRDGRGPNGDAPPNDWISAFGGSAWTRVTEPEGAPGQWYLHLFAPEQPDLNWANAQVGQEFADILRFWFDLGIDGFRVDAASGFAKHPDLPDSGFGPDARFTPRQWTDAPLWDVDAVHQIFRDWREIANSYDPPRVLIGEVSVNGSDRLASYLRPDELHAAFGFDYLDAPWQAKALRHAIDTDMAALQNVGAPPTWVQSSHDATRIVTRYGRADTSVPASAPAQPPLSDLRLGTRRARAAALLTLALPGNACIYQGDELGLWQVEDLPVHLLADPIVGRTGNPAEGRDGCRVPLPWTPGSPGLGFSPTGQTWLPQPHDWARLSAASQARDPRSMLSLYRQALSLRRQRQLGSGSITWLDSATVVDGGLLAFTNQDVLVMVNTASVPTELSSPATVLLASRPLIDEGHQCYLPADTTVWLQASPPADV